jgi:hypothetical protein
MGAPGGALWPNGLARTNVMGVQFQILSLDEPGKTLATVGTRPMKVYDELGMKR